MSACRLIHWWRGSCGYPSKEKIICSFIVKGLKTGSVGISCSNTATRAVKIRIIGESKDTKNIMKEDLIKHMIVGVCEGHSVMDSRDYYLKHSAQPTPCPCYQIVPNQKLRYPCNPRVSQT